MEPSGDSWLTKSSPSTDERASNANDNSASGASVARLRGGVESHRGSTILRTSPVTPRRCVMSPRSGLLSLRIALVLYGLLLPSVPSFAGDAAGKIPLTTKSEEARAAYLKGRDLFERLKFADAREQFKRAVELDPAFAMAQLQLANTLPTAREFNETVAQAQAVSASASKGEQMQIAAGVAGAHGDNTEQCRVLKELTSTYPKDERAWT